jgi:hypothetical protein
MQRVPSGLLEAKALAASIGLLITAATPRVTAEETSPSSGPRLIVTRSERASTCPDADRAAVWLDERWRKAGAHVDALPLLVQIDFDADAAGYTAWIRVSGRRFGARMLREVGDDCTNLVEALRLYFEVLFDDEAMSPPQPAVPILKLRRARTEGTSIPPDRSSAPSLWAGVGTAATDGVPYGANATPFGRLSLSLGAWRLAVTGFWSTPRGLAFGPGELSVGATGVQGSGCSEPLRWRWGSVGACVVASGVALTARAAHYTGNAAGTRPWWLAGGGPVVSWRPQPGIEFGLGAYLLASLHREAFAIDPLGLAYVTPAVTGWAEAEAGLRIW